MGPDEILALGAVSAASRPIFTDSDCYRGRMDPGVMAGKVKPVPDGFPTASPRIYLKGVAEAVEFYKRAFGAHELGLAADPAGRIVSAEIKIGDSLISLAEESPEWLNFSPRSLGGATMIMTLNVEDADAVWGHSVSSGANIIFPLEDQPYGYRQGRIADRLA